MTVSFFDEDDEPRRGARPRPRRAAPAGGPRTDSQTLLARRAVAGVVLLVFLLLCALGINACRTSQKKGSLRDYNRQVSSIATESRQTGGEFFKLFDQAGGQSPQDLQTAISSSAVQANQQLEQARGLDVPGDMSPAQQSLLIALELRRDGLQAIASRVRTALGDQGDAADQAIAQIAGQMSGFLASDVLYTARVRPFIRSALQSNGVTGQAIASSRFLPSASWLAPATVAQKLGQQLSGASGTTRKPGEPTGPGLHGTGIDSTTYGSTTLQPGTPNRLTYTPNQPFVVKFTNGGDNDEFDIKVTLKIQAASGPAITLTKTVSKVAQGAQAEASFAPSRTPPIGAAVTISVNVAPVPGEKKTDNNSSQYQALFSR